MCLGTEVSAPATREGYLNITQQLGKTSAHHLFWQNETRRRRHWWMLWFLFLCSGEESLTIFVDKRKLSKRSERSDPSTNSSAVTLETLHQLAASYFIDRDSTLRRLHHIQIASTAIKVGEFLQDQPADVFPVPLAASQEKRVLISKKRFVNKTIVFVLNFFTWIKAFNWSWRF